MILSRESIQRMITDMVGGGGGAGISSSALANLLTGYATQDWVGENYISIEFFSRLFQAHGTESGQQTDIAPNDMDSTITSIESLFGFWTDYYLSALGNGGGLGSTLYLSTLADVLISSPANNQVLTYNATIGKWVNANAQAGVTQLSALSDVTLTTPSANQVLIYDSTNQRWINTSLKTINYQSIIGSGDISVGGGASGNYLPLTGGTIQTSSVEWALNIFNTQSNIKAAAFISNCDGYGMWLGVSRTDASHYILNLVKGMSDYGSGGSTALYVRADGNVGIGTNSPSYTLDISGISRTDYLFFKNTARNGNCGYIGKGSPSIDEIQIQGYAGSNLSLGSNDHGNVIFLNSSGYVGIRTKNVEYPLDVQGTTGWAFHVKNENAFLYVCNSDSYGMYLGCKGNNSSNYIIRVDSDVLGDGTGGFHAFEIKTNGNVGIGTIYPSYKLHVDGTIYATGAVTALSDIRKKDVLSTDVGLTVEQIADAPTIKFLWKDRRNEGKQVGSVAQFWAVNLPEVVMDKGGELSMQYGVAALVSSIITARKVVDHERRISELEKENERLKTEVEQLRLN